MIVKCNRENFNLLIDWWENSNLIFTNYNDLKIISKPTKNKKGVLKVSEIMYSFLTTTCNIS